MRSSFTETSRRGGQKNQRRRSNEEDERDGEEGPEEDVQEGSRSILVIRSGMVSPRVLLFFCLLDTHQSRISEAEARGMNEVNVGSCEPSVGSKVLGIGAT